MIRNSVPRHPVRPVRDRANVPVKMTWHKRRGADGAASFAGLTSVEGKRA
jgi:hypothetical protein